MQSPYRITFRVRYAETDQMGVVYHANYFAWFEMGRVELLREMGFSYRQMEQEDCHLPVVEASCRYRAPAHYDETLELETRIGQLRGSLIRFNYRLWRRGEGEITSTGPQVPQSQVLAEAETTHLVVDSAMRKRRLPEKYSAVLLAVVRQGRSVDDGEPESTRDGLPTLSSL